MSTDRLKKTAAIVAVLAAAYPASAWYLGKKIETAHTELDAQFAAHPWLKLVGHDYQRGLLSATELITLEVPAEIFARPTPPPAEPAPEEEDEDMEDATPAPPPPPAPAAAPLPPIRITLKSEIQHGPFPGFAGFGAGRATTVVAFDEATQQKLAAAFGGKPPLDVQTLYRFDGGGLSTITSPAFKFSFPAANADGGTNTLSSEGLSLSVDFARGLERYSVNGDAPRLEVLDAAGAKVFFSGLKITSTQQRMFADDPLLHWGTTRIALAGMTAVPGQQGGPNVGIKDLSYEVSIPAAGEHIDLVAKIGTGEFKVDDRNFGPAHYDFTLRHVHARKLAALHRGAMALYLRPTPGQEDAETDRIFESLKKQALELVMEKPEFSLDRLSIHTADGDASLSARIKLNDPRPEDFANPMMLAAKVDFGAEVALPAALITALQSAASEDKGEALMRNRATEQAVANATQQGYLTNEAGILKTRIAFRNGEMKVNDKPFNPMAFGAPPQ